jgi:hypothetical protein
MALYLADLSESAVMDIVCVADPLEPRPGEPDQLFCSGRAGTTWSRRLGERTGAWVISPSGTKSVLVTLARMETPAAFTSFPSAAASTRRRTPGIAVYQHRFYDLDDF